MVLDYEYGDPKITKDGVTVIKSISVGNRAAEMGAKLLKKSAGSTNIFAGDGTTSSSVLSREIITRGINAVENENAHPIAIKRGLNKGMQLVQKFLKEIAMPVTTEEEIQAVCSVSSNYNDGVS